MILFYLFGSQVARFREGRFEGRLLCVSHQGIASKLWNPKEEGSGFTNCADTDDGTFRNRNKIVMKRMSSDHSLCQALCAVLPPYCPVECSHGVCYPHFTKEETEAYRDEDCFLRSHSKWRSKDLNPCLLRSESLCSRALCHIILSSACLLPARQLLPTI